MNKDLPEEIESAIAEHRLSVADWIANERVYDVPQAEEVLRNTIRAALDERDTALRASAKIIGATMAERDALRERTERLRRALIDEGFTPTLDEGDGDAYPFNPGDLADNLIPRKGDVLES